MRFLRATIAIGFLLISVVIANAEDAPISVARFQGPQSVGVREIVVQALESAVYETREGGNTGLRVTGKIRKRRKKLVANISLVSPQGEILVTITARGRNATALKRNVRAAIARKMRPAIEHFALPNRVEEEEDDDDDETEESDDDTTSRDSHPGNSAATGLAGWGVNVAIAGKTLTRKFGYGGDLKTIAPSYTLPLTWVAELSASYFWRENIEVALHVTLPRNLQSTVSNGDGFPTKTYAFDVDGRYYLGRFHGAIGYGNHNFGIENAETTPKPNIPSVSYHYLRVGGGYWHPIQPKYQIAAALGYRAVIAAGEIQSDSFYSDSSASGLDFSLSAKYLHTQNTFLNVSMEFQRYSHSMPEGTATDVFFGVGVAAGVNL